MGGSEIAQLRIIEGLASAGWAVDLLYVHRGDLWPRWQACAADIRTLRAAGMQRDEPIRSLLGALDACVGIVRSGAQVVYLHNPADLPAALVASRLARTPIVMHLHLPPPYRQPEWLNRLLRKADALVTPSKDTAERWVRVARVSGSRVSVIPTGVDSDHFVPLPDTSREEQRRALGLDPGIPMILYAGRIDPTKGLDHLLQGTRRMRQQANLVICGDCPDYRFLQSLHRDARNAHDDHVVWLDRRLDIAPLLGAADLVVLPSLVHETQGMVLIEGMSCGTPAVASAIGGLPETLAAFPEHLVPPGDPAALALTLDRLVHWRLHAPMLGEASRQWVRDKFELSRTVGIVSALLDDLRR